MGSRSIEDLHDELNRLMREHIDGLDVEVYTGRLTKEEYRTQADRLKRIHEVSADYIAALKRHGRA
jgi:hypothetical protein